MKNKLIIACIILLCSLKTIEVKAQYLPVVYNYTYEGITSINQTISISNSGDVLAIGQKGNQAICIWLDRNGKTIFSKEFPKTLFSSISKIIPISEKKVLLVGRCEPLKRAENKASGKAIVLCSDGGVEKEFFIGNDKTNITDGTRLSNDDFLFWGDQQVDGGSSVGYISRYSSGGDFVFEFASKEGLVCSFAKENDKVSYITAVFNGYHGEGTEIVKLDGKGSPMFITPILDKSFVVEECILSDGYTYVAGNGSTYGGSVIKIRPEGDIVYQKQIIDGTANTTLNKLLVNQDGNLLVGGSDSANAIFCVLRQDGTSLQKMIFPGSLSAIASNKINGDIAVTLYNNVNKRGVIVKLSSDGKKLYEKSLVAKYSQIRIDPNGDILLGSVESGRISMLSAFGELLFDRYIDNSNLVSYSDMFMANNGEVILTNGVNNITKLAHGIYIDDVKITKPTNGFATAVFTVSLSGYAFSEEGAPVSVSVDYKTKFGTANSTDHYNDVSGTLSFVSNGSSEGRYMNRQTIEVPIKSNNFIEGEKQFTLELSNVEGSYIIKNSGLGTIEDQQCIVKMIATEDGVEGEKNIKYELGLFKSNGVELVNKTGSDIVVDGKYGKGTADNLDYNYTKSPRLKIANNSHSGAAEIETLEDTRYESLKTLYVNFDKIHAMSDTKVLFPSDVLICEGKIYDQPAYVSISSLGTQNQLNNTVTGFANVSLHRAKDGAVQTNNTGSDVIVEVGIDSTSTAVKGVDFAFVNAHDLKIAGDGKQGSLNLNAIVLYNPDNRDDKELVVNLKSVNQIPDAGAISISKDEKQSVTLIKTK